MKLFDIDRPKPEPTEEKYAVEIATAVINIGIDWEVIHPKDFVARRDELASVLMISGLDLEKSETVKLELVSRWEHWGQKSMAHLVRTTLVPSARDVLDRAMADWRASKGATR